VSYEIFHGVEKMMVAPAVILVFLFAGVSGVLADKAEKKERYAVDEMPEVMGATWKEDVIGNADPSDILALLKRGQLVIIDEHTTETKWLVSGGILVNARPQTCFSVITDMENYDKFMPMTENARATELGPDIVRLDLTLKLKIVRGIPPIPIDYAVLHYHRPPLRSDWTHYSGRFERNDGFYQFVPVEGDRTMAFYTLYSLPRFPMAASLFKKDPNLELTMNMSTAVMVTRALKERAEKIEGREPFLPGDKEGSVLETLAEDPGTVKLLLERGGLILIEDGPPVYVTTAVAVDASEGRAFGALTRFEEYPCYQSQVKKAETLEKSPDSARAKFRVVLDYAILNIPLQYELSYTIHPPESIEYEWAAGDVPGQKGNWSLFRLPESGQTLLILRQTEDLKSLPGLMGKGLKMSIRSQPSLEPAILGGQALLTARNMREFLDLSLSERKSLLEKCKRR